MHFLAHTCIQSDVACTNMPKNAILYLANPTLDLCLYQQTLVQHVAKPIMATALWIEYVRDIYMCKIKETLAVFIRKKGELKL